jgi:ATP adenylyltransferase
MPEPGRYAEHPDSPGPYDPAGGVVGRTGVGVPDGLMRLWTPYRMAYHETRQDDPTADDDGSPVAEPGPPACPFCQIPAMDDADGLVLHRAEHSYVVLNLYPYNPGHLLVVPYRHVADLTELTSDERAESLALAADAMTAVRNASGPDGFNVGMNQGAISGGSVPGHLHLHVVPRWTGDAGFITVIGQTKNLPLLLEATWGMVRQHWPDRPRP